jgi:hypothetical protein
MISGDANDLSGSADPAPAASSTTGTVVLREVSERVIGWAAGYIEDDDDVGW